MDSLVDVESGFLCEAFETDIALEGSLSRVGAHVYLQVRFAGERGRTLRALVWSPLHFTPTH